MLFFSRVLILFTVHCFTLMNSNGKEPTNPSDCLLGESGLRPLWSLCWVTHCSVCRSASLLHSYFCSVVWSLSVKSASSTAVCTDLGPHQTRLLRHCWDMNNNAKVASFFNYTFICLISVWLSDLIISLLFHENVSFGCEDAPGDDDQPSHPVTFWKFLYCTSASCPSLFLLLR